MGSVLKPTKPSRRPPEVDVNGMRARQLWGQLAGADIAVVGTGPSLAGFNWSSLAGRPWIALNDAVKAAAAGAPPVVHLFADVNIWNRYEECAMGNVQAILCHARARKYFLKSARCAFKDRIYQFESVADARGLMAGDDQLFVDRTIATGGISLAWKLGARRIFLLGVDGYKIRRRDGREIYYHDGSAKPPERRREVACSPDGLVTQDRHEAWVKDMRELRDRFKALGVYACKWPGDGVYNLSPRSTIDAWPKVKPEDVL